MSRELFLAYVAVGIGLVIGVVVFVPVVTVAYRRRGRLGAGFFALIAAAVVYSASIWTYTLLPLPDPAAISCAGVNLRPGEFLVEIRRLVAGPGLTLTDPAVLQPLLNVLLFVPLGVFLRVLFNRGVVVSLAVGLLVSAFIETTQLTGVWGLYPCAYRVFDVDDLITNTAGAVIGSLLALIVPRSSRGLDRPDAGEPHPVTRGRRLLAMLCDALGLGLTEATVAVAVQAWLYYGVGDHEAVAAGSAAGTAAVLAASAVWLAVVLVTGRSVGDIAVQLRYRGGPTPVAVARVLRWLGGISGYALLGLLPSPWTLLQIVFGVMALLLVLTTTGGRGIPGLLAGARLTDARERAD